MIEDFVNFETAKLLKEKGFNWEVHRSYLVNDNCFAPADVNDLPNRKDAIRIPTLQMAMKWLREVHSLYIDIVTSFSQDGICYTFSCSNTMDLIQGTKGTSYHEYQTYEEAAEEAVLYCLQNLI